MYIIIHSLGYINIVKIVFQLKQASKPVINSTAITTQPSLPPRKPAHKKPWRKLARAKNLSKNHTPLQESRGKRPLDDDIPELI